MNTITARLSDLDEIDGDVVAQAIDAVECDDEIKIKLVSLIRYFNHEHELEEV